MPLTPRAATRSRASEQTPEELALRAQAGSLAAFSELVGRFEGRLFNFLLRRVGSAADAEDLTQDTFLRAWQRIGTYRPTWRFSTWLFTIATRLAVSSARRVSSRRESIRDDHGARATPLALPDDGVARSRIWSMVSELLGPEQQTALWLRYVEDMAVKDIATVLGRTQVSVRVMLFRARAVLAPALEQERAALDDAPPPPITISRPLQPGARC
jgi:RNA polymerase sigma-70 factor (ECF subfamily)